LIFLKLLNAIDVNFKFGCIICRPTIWKHLAVTDHERPNYQVEKQSSFDVTYSNYWQLLVEAIGGLIVLKKQELVHSEEYDIEDHREWVKQWHTCREHHDAPQICVILGINVVTRNLVTCVKSLKILDKQLFGVD